MAKNLEKELIKQVEQIKEISARTSDPCTTAICVAFMDSKVQEIFFRKVGEEHVFLGAHCEPSMLFEHVTVVINFRCADGVFCIIPPTFAADVNIIAGEVTRIHDPYFPRTAGIQPAPSTGAAYVTGRNNG